MPEHKSLAAALLAFQQNPPHIELDSKNPHFKSKFAGLPGITKAVKPRLTEEGLVYTQPLDHIDGAPAIRTVLLHPASGESIVGVSPLLLGGKTDPQSHGSAITYARRYALLAILGLVGDEDDDGNAASATPTKTAGGVATPSPPSPAVADSEAEALPFGDDPVEPQSVAADNLLSKAQNGKIGVLVSKLTEAGVTDVGAVRTWMGANLGKTSRATLTKKEASAVIEWLVEQEEAAGLAQ